MSNISKSVKLYSNNAHQSTGWKLAMRKAITEDNMSKNDITQKIRSERGKEGWDGNTNDRHFQQIKQCVNRAMQSLTKQSQFDMSMFNTLCTRDSQQVLNRKNSIHMPSRKKKEKLIGAKQYDLEEKLMSCINEIWTKKRRVSRVIIFRHTHKNFPWFEGGKASPTYFADMKS